MIIGIKEECDALPLVVAVTGHRDLVAAEKTVLRQKAREFFLELADQFPSRKLRLLSPLAEGADQLVAEVAVDRDPSGSGYRLMAQGNATTRGQNPVDCAE